VNGLIVDRVCIGTLLGTYCLNCSEELPSLDRRRVAQVLGTGDISPTSPYRLLVLNSYLSSFRRSSVVMDRGNIYLANGGFVRLRAQERISCHDNRSTTRALHCPPVGFRMCRPFSTLRTAQSKITRASRYSAYPTCSHKVFSALPSEHLLAAALHGQIVAANRPAWRCCENIRTVNKNGAANVLVLSVASLSQTLQLGHSSSLLWQKRKFHWLFLTRDVLQQY
jgi:hypothetical protein